MDNYCDRFVTSMPISIPLRKNPNDQSLESYKNSYKTSTSVGSGSKITDSIYKYISYSIDNIKKLVV